MLQKYLSFYHDYFQRLLIFSYISRVSLCVYLESRMKLWKQCLKMAKWTKLTVYCVLAVINLWSKPALRHWRPIQVLPWLMLLIIRNLLAILSGPVFHHSHININHFLRLGMDGYDSNCNKFLWNVHNEIYEAWSVIFLNLYSYNISSNRAV